MVRGARLAIRTQNPRASLAAYLLRSSGVEFEKFISEYCEIPTGKGPQKTMSQTPETHKGPMASLNSPETTKGPTKIMLHNDDNPMKDPFHDIHQSGKLSLHTPHSHRNNKQPLDSLFIISHEDTSGINLSFDPMVLGPE
eukprot:990978_1